LNRSVILIYETFRWLVDGAPHKAIAVVVPLAMAGCVVALQ
jgi:hypothetical protein